MWLRRRRPGTVRIKARELVELQRSALRSFELERRIRETHRQTAQLEAQVLLIQRGQEGLDSVVPLLAEPPLTAAGELHEAAFLAAVDAAVWADRERELAEMVAGARAEGEAR